MRRRTGILVEGGANIRSCIQKLDRANAWLWLIILIGFALQVYRLGYRPLWDDEAFSVLLVSSDIRNVALAAVKDTFPPFHYYIMSIMMIATGWSEFSIRFASLMGSLLAIPVTYQLGKALISRQVGLWAALVIAFSPFQVYFAQEARAYSWMVLTSLLSAYTFVRIISSLSSRGRASPGQWITFSFMSAIMLYTHFLSLWILVVEGLYFFSFWWHHKRGFRAWITAHIAIGILFLPWMLLMLGIGTGEGKSNAGVQQIGGIQTDAPIAALIWIWQEGQAARGSLSLVETLRQALVSFTVGDYLPPSWGWAMALGFACIAVLGMIGMILRRGNNTQTGDSSAANKFPYPVLFLILYALLPVLLSYFVAFPTSRPHWAKYFMMALPAYTLLVALGLAVLRRWHWLLAFLGTAFVIGASIAGLYNYIENPAHARSDIRPAIRYMEAFSSPNDALLANPPGSSAPLWFYYHGNLPHYTPNQINETLLQEIAATHDGLWVVQNLPVGFDPDQTIERWLTYHTYRSFTEWVGQLVFRYYSMPAKDGPVLQQNLEHPVLFGDSIALQGYRLSDQTAGRVQVVQLELLWQARTDMDEEYMVGTRIIDNEGRVWGQTNSAPLGNFRPTINWTTGETVKDHLGLLLWPGTPPGLYSVQVWMYRENDGAALPISEPGKGETREKLDVGTIHINAPQYPPVPSMLGMTESVVEEFGDVRLLGYQIAENTWKPGDVINLALFWEANAANLPTYSVSLGLEAQNGKQWSDTTVIAGGMYPTDLWTTGQIIRQPLTLTLPADAPDGTYRLKLTISDNTNDSNGPVELLSVEVKDRAKQFSMPRIQYTHRENLGNQVEFLGYDLPKTYVSPGESVPLTLYWRAIAPTDTSYTVFNHLIGANGTLGGQWDSIPLQGTLPTTEWVEGEIIKDAYGIPIQDDAAPGLYQLVIGLYDAVTGERVRLFTDEDAPLATDSITLDSQIEIR